MTDSTSAATLVFENDLIRSEIFEELDPCHEVDLRACALTSKAGFRTAVGILWQNVSLGQVNNLYQEECPVDRLEHYLRAIRLLSAPTCSLVLDDDDFPPKLLVTMARGPWAGDKTPPYSQIGDIDLSLEFEGPRSGQYSLSGCEHLPNLLNFDVEIYAIDPDHRCFGTMGAVLNLRSGHDIHVVFSEIHDLGGRSVSTDVNVDNDLMLNWQEPMMCPGGSSRLDSLRISDWSDKVVDSLMSEAEQLQRQPDHRTRLYEIRSLVIERAAPCEELSAILALCPKLQKVGLNLGRYCIDGDDDPSKLLEWFRTGADDLESIYLEDGDLDWLPYLRQCQEVELRCWRPPVIRPWDAMRSSTAKTDIWGKRDGRKLERLAIRMLGLRADSDAEAIIGFIQAHARQETQISVVVPGIGYEAEGADSHSLASTPDDFPETEWIDHIRQSVAHLKGKESASAVAVA